MPPTTNSPAGQSPGRIASIDAFRGLTILVMIFVNNIGGVKDIPYWFKHMAHDADGMTFVDVVFPAFLFIVGMAMPFSLGRRLERGGTRLAALGHVFVRTLGLLVVGVFMVNMPADSAATGMNGNLWSLLVFVAVILAWNRAETTTPRGRAAALGLRLLGAVSLIALAAIFRGRSGETVHGLRTAWWGILGLIGWAYLVASVIYLSSGRKMEVLVGGMAMLYALFLADKKQMFEGVWLRQYLDFGTQLGTHAAITMAGVVAGQMFFPSDGPRTPWARVRWLVLYGVVLFVAGMLLRPYGGVNKTAATPAWCLYSAAWCCWIYAGLYAVMDIGGWTRWAAFVRPCGEHPLLAYLLSHVVYYALCFFPDNPLWNHANRGLASLIPYAMLALLLTLLTGWLGNRWVKLRL